MDFRLFYDGPLKSRRGPKEKYELRRQFHGQLKELLGRKSFAHYKRFLERQLVAPSDKFRTTVVLGAFRFVPFITEQLGNVARLQITLLTPEEPGNAVTQGGDLDNRIKTLLDSLRCPKEPSELPAGESPRAGEDPFFCLLQDDALIVELSVTADRLLRPGADSSTVVLVIRVTPESILTNLGETKILRG